MNLSMSSTIRRRRTRITRNSLPTDRDLGLVSFQGAIQSWTEIQDHAVQEHNLMQSTLFHIPMQQWARQIVMEALTLVQICTLSISLKLIHNKELTYNCRTLYSAWLSIPKFTQFDSVCVMWSACECLKNERLTKSTHSVYEKIARCCYKKELVENSMPTNNPFKPSGVKW